jgi:hypothetical protein
MPYSYTAYIGNGSNRDFTVPFGYLHANEITVTFDGVPQTFTILSNGQLRTDTAPANGSIVKIARNTAILKPRTDFKDGANLTEEHLDNAVRQNLYAIQEIRDDFNVLLDDINDGIIVGGDLPVGAPNNSFLVANGGTWNVLTRDQTRLLLGITAIENHIGDPGAIMPPSTGYPGMIVNTGSTYELYDIPQTRSFLKLGQLALMNTSDLGSAAFKNTGTSAGNVIVLDSTGKLPAVDGSQLTGLERSKYIRADRRTSSGAHGGTYTVAKSWVTVPITSMIVDETGQASVGSDRITVPAGKYEYRAWAHVRTDGFSAVRLSDFTSGGVIQQGAFKYYNGNEAGIFEVTGRVTFSVTTQIKMEVASTGVWNDARALGTAHADEDLGQNIYASIELWKLAE